MADKTKYNVPFPVLNIGDQVTISDSPGCMTHSGLAVGPVPEAFAGAVGTVCSEQEFGDYRIQVGPDSAWIATSHLTKN